MPAATHILRAVPTATDQELVAAVRHGDDRAFEELFSRYRRRISAYVYGMVGDHGRAEDITQEVFISALRRLRETDRPIAFKPWIYEIAKNACIDESRRAHRRQEVPLDTETDALPIERQALAGNLPPDAAIENKQQIDRLRGAFYGLSRDHHRILLMRELEGRSYDEIGERMEMTPPMVESTLFRARRRLGEEYQDLESGRRCSNVRLAVERVVEHPGRRVGIREHRRIALHLAHCEHCRRHARELGLHESYFRAQTFKEKLAALLPIPWLLRRRRKSDKDDSSGGAAVDGSAGGVGVNGALAARGLQLAGKFAEPISHVSGSGRVAAVLGALALTTAAGGVVALNVHSGRAAVGSGGPGGSATSHHSGTHAGIASGGGLQSTGATAGSSGPGASTATGLASGSAGGHAGGGPAGSGLLGRSGSIPRTISGRAGTSAGGVLGGAGSTVGRTVSGAGGGISGVGNSVGHTISGAGGAGQQVGKIVQGAGNTVGGTVQSVGKQLGGGVPGVTNPVSTPPPVKTPSVTTPGVTTPGVTTPGVTTPGVTTPGVTTPGVTTPGVTTPGLTTPSVTTPTLPSPGPGSGLPGPGNLASSAAHTSGNTAATAKGLVHAASAGVGRVSRSVSGAVGQSASAASGPVRQATGAVASTASQVARAPSR
jgi:RNA polymerase sigma factor (sigma-70 family)